MDKSLPAPGTAVPLWSGPAPESHGDAATDIPTLTVFLPENPTHATPAIIIFPGGGYEHLSFDHEGINVAKYFAEKGLAAFVLRYRLPVNGYRHPVPLLDAQHAVRFVRSHATEWDIDPAKVGIMGFSAGGHLAATLATHFDPGNDQAADPVNHQSCRPSFAVLAYAVISMQDGITHSGSKKALLGPNPDPAQVENLSNETQVTPQTPPTLLVHSVDDGAVPIANSRLMHAALEKAGVATALQEYPTGGHGFGYGKNSYNNNAPEGWLDQAYDWLMQELAD